jgi:hypothetical protein
MKSVDRLSPIRASYTLCATMSGKVVCIWWFAGTYTGMLGSRNGTLNDESLCILNSCKYISQNRQEQIYPSFSTLRRLSGFL